MSRADTTGKNKSQIRPLIRTTVTLVVLFLLVRYVMDHRGQFEQVLSHLTISIFAGMFLAQVLNSLTFGLGFHAILKAHDAPIRLLPSLRIFAVSRFLGTFIPHSGLVYRGVALKQEAGMEIKDYVHATIAFTWFILVASLLIAMFPAFLANEKVTLLGLDSRLLIVAIFVAAAASPFVGHFLLHAFKFSLGPLNGFLTKFKAASTAIIHLMSNRSLMFWFMVISVGSLIVTTAMLYLAFLSGGQKVGVYGLVLLFVAFRLNGITNFTPGNIGLLELILGYIAVAQGIDHSVGVFAVLTVRVVGFASMIFMTVVLGGSDAFMVLKRRGAITP